MKPNPSYAIRYEQVRSPNFRSVIRYSALSALSSFDAVTGRGSSRLKTNGVQFLYLHHVFEDEEDSFRLLIRTLQQDHRLISYSDAVNRILMGEINGHYVAISLDDGLKNCLRAARILDEFGVQACFFLCLSMVGETDYQTIKQFCAQKLHMPPLEFLSWDDADLLLRSGHEVGSHAITHTDLAQLPVERMQDEIRTSFEILTQRAGRARHFAWPLGRFDNFSPTAVKTVFEAGFESCASAERGCHVFQKNKLDLCIRRDHVICNWPASHLLYFMARNKRKAASDHDLWPDRWRELIQGEK